MTGWQIFIIGVIGATMGRLVYEILKDVATKRREAKFIKLVSVAFPDKTIAYISVDSSDRRALRELERQLREDYNIPEDSYADIFRRLKPKKRDLT